MEGSFHFLFNLRLSRVNDLRELLGNEGRTADEAAVNVDLGEELCCVAVVHGAAVLDRESLSYVVIVVHSRSSCFSLQTESLFLKS